MIDLACRTCGKTDVPLTVIYRNDGTGQLAPQAAVCRGGCFGTRDTTPPRVTRTAIRPGFCASCGSEIIPPERIRRTADGAVHARCAPG